MQISSMVRDLSREFGAGAQLEAWDRASCATDSETRRAYLAIYHYYKALEDSALPTFVRVASESESRVMNSKHLASLGKLIMERK